MFRILSETVRHIPPHREINGVTIIIHISPRNKIREIIRQLIRDCRFCSGIRIIDNPARCFYWHVNNTHSSIGLIAPICLGRTVILITPDLHPGHHIKGMGPG